MQVSAAASASAAMALAQAAVDAGLPLPLVITDAHMPGEDGFDLARQLRQNVAYTGAPILMLTSSSQPGDPARSRELGVAAHLTKPVSPKELRQVICRLLDRGVEAPLAAPVAGSLPDSSQAAASRKIVLAEDNPINQVVAVRLLEKRGHRVTVAANGREAVAAIRREPFDLVLMDVQMPEMDGLEATATIRREEADTGKHLPVFAMTAHTMKGDAERAGNRVRRQFGCGTLAGGSAQCHLVLPVLRIWEKLWGGQSCLQPPFGRLLRAMSEPSCSARPAESGPEGTPQPGLAAPQPHPLEHDSLVQQPSRGETIETQQI